MDVNEVPITHTTLRIWPNVVIAPDMAWWLRWSGYLMAVWFIAWSTIAHLPMALQYRWSHVHEPNETDCAFIEIGVNGKRWLRW